MDDLELDANEAKIENSILVEDVRFNRQKEDLEKKWGELKKKKLEEYSNISFKTNVNNYYIDFTWICQGYNHIIEWNALDELLQPEFRKPSNFDKKKCSEYREGYKANMRNVKVGEIYPNLLCDIIDSINLFKNEKIIIGKLKLEDLFINIDDYYLSSLNSNICNDDCFNKNSYEYIIDNLEKNNIKIKNECKVLFLKYKNRIGFSVYD